MYSGGSKHPEVKKWLKDKGLTMKDVKRHILEFYPNGQVKTIIEYVGVYDTRRCMELGWIDYDEDGNLLEFADDDPYDTTQLNQENVSRPRLEWTIGMHNKYYAIMNETEKGSKLLELRDGVIFAEHPNQDPDTNKKDFPTMWECALYVKNLITIGALDLKFNEGYQWATKHCTIQGADIDDWKKLKKNYENAKDRHEEKVCDFEGIN